MPTEIQITVACECPSGIHKAGGSVGVITREPLTEEYLQKKMVEHMDRFARSTGCSAALVTITNGDGTPVNIAPPRRV